MPKKNIAHKKGRARKISNKKDGSLQLLSFSTLTEATDAIGQLPAGEYTVAIEGSEKPVIITKCL